MKNLWSSFCCPIGLVRAQVLNLSRYASLSPNSTLRQYFWAVNSELIRWQFKEEGWQFKEEIKIGWGGALLNKSTQRRCAWLSYRRWTHLLWNFITPF